MFKIKKKIEKPKPPVLYNVIEDYSEFDAPGNVTVCAMTLRKIRRHMPRFCPKLRCAAGQDGEAARRRRRLCLPAGGRLAHSGPLRLPRGSLRRRTQTDLDLGSDAIAEAEQWARARTCPLLEAAAEVFHRTLPEELKTKLTQKNLGLDYRTLDRAVAKGGDIKYIDFRKDWSPHFKRLCIMPDGRLVETGGLEEFAQLHQITVPQAKKLVEEGGTMDLAGGEVLACQIVNGQPAVARFSAKIMPRRRSWQRARGCTSWTR